MIQRIQTLYLLIIAALMAVTLFSGLAWFAGDDAEKLGTEVGRVTPASSGFTPSG